MLTVTQKPIPEDRYIELHAQMAELVEGISEAVQNIPCPDDSTVRILDWTDVGELERKVNALRKVALFLKGDADAMDA